MNHKDDFMQEKITHQPISICTQRRLKHQFMKFRSLNGHKPMFTNKPSSLNTTLATEVQLFKARNWNNEITQHSLPYTSWIIKTANLVRWKRSSFKSVFFLLETYVISVPFCWQFQYQLGWRAYSEN